MQPDSMNARRILLDLFDVALRAVDGRARVDRFLREARPAAPVEVFAVGKAASSMARGAQDALGSAVEVAAVTPLVLLVVEVTAGLKRS